jgi:hypothetical protein
MHYKSIVLDLLVDQYPTLHEDLRRRRALLQALDRYSTDLKARHDAWKSELAQARPETSPTQIASEALEMAIEELRDHLSAESEIRSTSAETLSLDEAMAYIRRHTPHG